MSTELHTFIDIFNSPGALDQEAIAIKKISIPIIQRDYAQGRMAPDVTRVRKKFLDSLHAAVTGEPLTLDFVYGDVDEEGVMTPLDGQQRLTTLFLLHWYAAKRTKLDRKEYAFLEGFGYETRYSARDFCSLLLDFEPDFAKPLSEEIVNQPWFPYDWLKDPTVASMLVMLDDIQRRFEDVGNLWKQLKDGAVSFYFLEASVVCVTRG